MLVQFLLNRGRKLETGVAGVAGVAVAALFVLLPAIASPPPWQEPVRTGWVLAWIHRDGRVEPLPFGPQRFAEVRLSPDERQIAVTISGGGRQIWIYELGSGETRQLTFEGSNDSLLWSPDGTWLYFRSDRTGEPEIWRKRVDASGEAERVLAREGRQSPSGISADGNDLWFYEEGNLYRLRLGDPSTTPQPIRVSEETMRFAVVSASADLEDLFAYQLSAEGRQEVFVASITDGDERLIGSPFSLFPSWSDDGRTLFYLSRDEAGNRGLSGVNVAIGASGPMVSSPAVLFPVFAGSRATYDVSANGERLLMPIPPDAVRRSPALRKP